MPIKIINIYIARTFLLYFFKIIAFFAILFFTINFIENGKHDIENLFLWLRIQISILPILSQLSSIIASIVLLTAIACFHSLASRSEITIITGCKYSLWKLCRPVVFTAFVLGILWITLIQHLVEMSFNRIAYLEKKYQYSDKMFSEGKDVLWLKQENNLKSQEIIIIGLGKYNKSSDMFADVGLWFFDKNLYFYQKISADYAKIEYNQIILSNGFINNKTNINQPFSSMQIPTTLTREFLQQKVMHNFAKLQTFSLFSIPKIINELNNAGLNPKKFIIYLHSLLVLPFNFVAMILISAYFGINHIRNRMVILKLFVGILCGLLIYIIDNITKSFGSANMISTFSAIWLINLIFIAIGILLIYYKEKNLS